MPILNYTTTVDALKSLGEIQGILVRHGAREVSIGYTNGIASSIAFSISTRHGDLKYRLPSNVSSVYATLQQQRRKLKLRPGLVTEEQAGRIAWRILKDWIEVQLAIVEIGLATLDQVMLPYELDRRTGETFYQIITDSRPALPAPENGKG